jgi:hypothetical protein
VVEGFLPHAGAATAFTDGHLRPSSGAHAPPSPIGRRDEVWRAENAFQTVQTIQTVFFDECNASEIGLWLVFRLPEPTPVSPIL